MFSRVERNAGWMLVLVVLLILAAVSYSLYYRWKHTTTVRIGDTTLTAVVADTDATRAEGLSNRSSLNKNEAMLFVYNRDSKWAMWMDGVRFSIDIIWLDKNKKVVHITKNVSPDTYPETFIPSDPARYVLEVEAGTVDEYRIDVDQQAHFELRR